MEKDWKLLSPLGVSDILESDCALKRSVETDIARVLESFGYNEIQTPTFEYYNVFADDLSIPHEDIIKFIDKSGRILALRPDYTTAISRLVASRKSDFPKPLRFRYCGNIFRSSESYTEARQKEFTQAGAELFGAASPDADAEIIIMTIEALLKTGLDEFQIELGHTNFLRGIVRGILNDDELDELTGLIDKKFILGIEEFCAKAGIKGEKAEILCEMPNLYGDFSVAEKMRRRSLSPESAEALDNLLAVYEAVRDYGYEKYISVDLGLVRSFKYYTGMVFKGITYGVAFPVCGGGRYDSLSRRFGCEISATGTAIWTDRLMTALIRQKQLKTDPVTDLLVWYRSKESRGEAYAIARREREKGLRVVCQELPFADEKEAKEYIALRKIKSAVMAQKGAR